MVRLNPNDYVCAVHGSTVRKRKDKRGIYCSECAPEGKGVYKDNLKRIVQEVQDGL